MYFIKNELLSIGLGDIWYNQGLFFDSKLSSSFYLIIKQRLFDCLKQDFDSQMNNLAINVQVIDIWFKTFVNNIIYVNQYQLFIRHVLPK